MTAGRDINYLRYANDITLIAESEEEENSFLKRVEQKSEKDGLKFNIQKTKIMDAVSSLHCKEMGNNVNNDRLYFLASKITADGDCSQEIKRHLLLGRKPMTNLDSISKTRDITFQQKSIESKLYFFQ